MAAVGNAEATKERILEAAMSEFAAYGVAGARVDRIAKKADCNKNLIYVYFQNKETLFTTVLEKNLVRIYKDLAFTADDLPGYATRVFDFAMEHPDILRLLRWSSLEQSANSVPARAASHDSKVAALEDAQDAGRLGTGFPPAFLMTTVLTLATAWSAASPFGTAIDPDAARDGSALRKSIADAIRLISNAN